MRREDLAAMSVEQLLEQTQTNVTSDPAEGLAIAQYAFERAKSPITLGTAARQAAIRAEQAGESQDVVDTWFGKSRDALSSNEPGIRRELIATELLTGRALSLRIERLGSVAVNLASQASEAFERGEAILQEQHIRGKAWDRFGTMLARHRATYEAMNGDAGFALATSIKGIWRAVRAKSEGTPERNLPFILKQVGMNAIASTLAISKPLSRSSKIADARHQVALKLLS